MPPDFVCNPDNKQRAIWAEIDKSIGGIYTKDRNFRYKKNFIDKLTVIYVGIIIQISFTIFC